MNFAIIAKIRYDNEIRKNIGIAKIQIFAMHSNFRYDSENFAIIAKFLLSLRKFRYAIAKLMCLHAASCISSSLIVLHPRLDEINEKSYELDINQQNYDVKLEMLVEAHKTFKTTKNNLKTKLVVLMDLHMSFGLNNMISTQKALKTYLK